MNETVQRYLEKSAESLASAKDDLAKKRFNSCANRTYYACYQAAVALLISRGVSPPGGKERWEHDFVQAQTSNLIRRKKMLPAKYRAALPELMVVRVTADYKPQSVSKRKAAKVLKTATEFVTVTSKDISK